MNIIKLTSTYHNQLKDLNNIVVSSMENPNWLISLTRDELENIFNNKTAIVYGMINDDNKLISVSGLFFDESDFIDITKILKIDKFKVGEISESMTIPQARGNNYMLEINNVILKEAKSMGFEYLIATADPENIASNKSLTKLGMECICQINRYGKYLRNCYMIKI